VATPPLISGSLYHNSFVMMLAKFDRVSMQVCDGYQVLSVSGGLCNPQPRQHQRVQSRWPRWPILQQPIKLKGHTPRRLYGRPDNGAIGEFYGSHSLVFLDT